MKKIINLVLLLFIAGILFISCDKDSTNPTGPDDGGAKELTLKTVDVPEAMKNSTDAQAATAMAWVNVVNGFQAYSTWFTVPQGATFSGGNGSYTWTRGPLSVTMFQSQVGDNYTWKLVLNGTEDGLTYNNWVFMEASQSSDEKNGWMKIYEDNSTVVASEWSWTTDSNGKYTFVFKNNDGESLGKIEIISNTDLSGELYVYTDNVLTSKTTWDKNGNGQWWQYDEQGNVSSSGSWSASS